MEKEEVLNHIKAQLKEYPVILYMKGTPQFPMCGFSGRVMQVLKEIGAKFSYVNILEEPEIRANMVHVSDWPTFPQLFVNGELIGGCDIIEEMHAANELAPILNAVVWDESTDAK